ncbi:helix-turn-helix transcriptional regulator [Micromonospora sp. WMMD964]|uniref:helix-turn-helix domain-containing protein n=1 Tax=Micromonospora TaxID=1873 RepID=UPI00249CAB15|nr:helix-turn-helix transcriptional regulator [Micromonospora sp. WMMD964]WFF02992.1 helix-turn-helix transcriptional regulator [Micromonospora sp. WMMD964]
MLEVLGLTPEAESVYRALLARPGCRPEGLVTELLLPEDAVRTALDELTRASLVRPARHDPQELLPVSPEVGLAWLLTKAEAHVDYKVKQIDHARAAMLALAAEQNAGRVQETIIRLDGVDAVRERLVGLGTSAQQEYLVLAPGGFEMWEPGATAGEIVGDAVGRGVRVRAVWQDCVLRSPAAAEVARWLAERGGEVRAMPVLPQPLLIVDGHVALMPMDPDEAGRGAIEVRSPGVVTLAIALFREMWTAAVAPECAASLSQDGVSLTEQQILRMLAAGQTDENIARKLGVSLRTVRRIMAQLMVRLGARSRFQAGTNAAKRGWI